jgi:hypothetical protein
MSPTNTQNIKKAISMVTVLAVTFMSLVGLLSINGSAESAVDVTLTPSQQEVNTSANITLSFATTYSYSANDTIYVVYDTAAYTGTPTATVNSNSATVSSVTGGVSLQLASGSYTSPIIVELSGLTTPVTAGNYSFMVTTDVGSESDFGGVFQYVGEANYVNVTAYIAPTLSFVIRNSDDTTNTNVCDLGLLTTTSVKSCSYRLKIGTNASSGYSVLAETTLLEDSNLNSIDPAAAGTAGTGGTEIVAGTENYGVVITPGANTTVQSAYNAGATNAVDYEIVGTPESILVSTSPSSPEASGDLVDTHLVTHQAAIGIDTLSSFYSQTVIYTVIPNFDVVI